jgi:hypothetical protein
MKYRFKHSVVIFRSKPPTPEGRGLDECCPVALVLASLEDPSTHKNDHELAYDIKAMDSDTVEFTIQKCGVDGNLDLLGESIIFPNDNLSVAFRFDWRQYLDQYGAGGYIIKELSTIAGEESESTWGEFRLMPWSRDTAERTTRIKTVFNSKSMASGADWTGSNAFTTLRLKGTFGDMEPNTVVRTPIDKGFKKVKTTVENLKSYTWVTDPIDYYFTSRLVDFHFRDGDEFFMTDENSLNHSYGYQDLPVSLSEKTSPKPEYNGGRTAVYTVEFVDTVTDQKSYYNVR